MTVITKLRLPAEWEMQSAVLIAWPHADTDWLRHLHQVENTYVAFAAAVTRFEPIVIVVANASIRIRALSLLDNAHVMLSRVRFVVLPYDDTWLRDSGPITLTDAHGTVQFTDFHFNGWGGKYDSLNDDALVAGLVTSGLCPQVAHRRINWVLEGGAIESDGAGTLLTTSHCLTHRHPTSSRQQLETVLCESLGAERVLWLEHGKLEGDDTDAHIDTLARFAPDQHIVFQGCDDRHDVHYSCLKRMGNELASMRTIQGQPYVLHALPMPAPIIDSGRRLAASYANYLIINDAVLVPAYDDAADIEAARIIATAYPGRKIIPIPCRPLIWQNGSLHCISMQLPAGLALTDADDAPVNRIL